MRQEHTAIHQPVSLDVVGLHVLLVPYPLAWHDQIEMSDRGHQRTPMDQAAKRRIMSAEYKENDGRATAWSKRAQETADRNEWAQSAADRNDGHTRGSRQSICECTTQVG